MVNSSKIYRNVTALPLILCIMHEAKSLSVFREAKAKSPLILRSASTSEATANSDKGGSWADNFGSSALRNVENLAQVVTRANDDAYIDMDDTIPSRNTGDTANLFSKSVVLQTQSMSEPLTRNRGQWQNSNQKVVASALESLERDMQLLDNQIAERPQLSQLEITLLSLSVAVAGSGPVLFADGAKIAEVLAPACAACKPN